eukprot:6462706-Amphidinium_carterae.1
MSTRHGALEHFRSMTPVKRAVRQDASIEIYFVESGIQKPAVTIREKQDRTMLGHLFRKEPVVERE